MGFDTKATQSCFPIYFDNFRREIFFFMRNKGDRQIDRQTDTKYWSRAFFESAG